MLAVKYISNAAIDRVLWDECLAKSACNLIYLQSYYLDAMADDWDAIVVNNYEAVMPLPFRKKWGIKYIYHPAFIQQLGLCSTNKNISLDDILPTIKKHFKYADLYLNYTNIGIQNAASKINYVLKLSNPYNFYVENYKNDLKKNLKRSNREFLEYRNDNSIEETISIYKKSYGARHTSITDNDYTNFLQLCNKLETNKKAFTRSVYDEAENLFAIGLFLLHNNRIYNVMNTTTALGKTNAANHFLFDKLIEEFSNSNYFLDFEGSELPGVKSFYENFYPENEPYFYYKINNLNPILKIFKK